MGASVAAASAGIVAGGRVMGLGLDSGPDFGEEGEAAGLAAQAGGDPEAEALILVGYPAAGPAPEAIRAEDLAVVAGAAGAVGPVAEVAALDLLEEDEDLGLGPDLGLDLDWGPAWGLLAQEEAGPEAEVLISEECSAAGPAWEAIQEEGLAVVAGEASSAGRDAGLGPELDLARGRE